MSLPGEERALRLLSLDGGGIRGLSELLILRELMHRLRVEENKKRLQEGSKPLQEPLKPCHYFDLIGGTSTGGIIALMLGRLQMDVNKAIDCYEKLVTDVFSRPKRLGGTKIFRAGRLEKAVKSIVEEELGNPDFPLLERENDTFCRTFVCCKNAYNAELPVLLRTYESIETPINCAIWEAARATTAAPKFFKRIDIGRTRKQPYIDGGLGVNNPTSVLLEEAQALFPTRKVGCLLSIGAGLNKPTEIPKSRPLKQILPTDIVEVLTEIATDCDGMHQDIYKHFANYKDTYFRFSVDRGMQDIKLSEWEKLGRVEAHTMQYMKDGRIKELFGALVDKIRAPKGELTAGQFISPHPPQLSRRTDKAQVQKRPHSVWSFAGRWDLLEKIHAYFSLGSQSRRIFVLHGLGGAGKTQLALKFLEESEQSACFSNIFYIDATNEQSIALYLIAITPEGVEKTVDASLDWLARRSDVIHGDWLLFFNNADDTSLNLSQFFPRCENGNILITTRNKALRASARGDNADVQVKGLDPDDAKSLLFQLSGERRTIKNEDLAQHIVEELHCFALAIAHAGAYIKCRSTSLRHYQDLYREKRDRLMQLKDVQSEDPAVYATWKLSYDQLDEPARAFLQVCCMLHHDGILEEMFSRAALSQLNFEDVEVQQRINGLLELLGKRDSGWDTWAFRQAVDSLSSYSLIEFDRLNNTYSVHPLVQHWGHATLGDKFHTKLTEVLSIISLSIQWRDDEYLYSPTLLQHIVRTMALAAVQEIDILAADWIANVYLKHGYFKEAEVLQITGMEKRKQQLGDNHLDTLGNMVNLAVTYQHQSRWKEAEALQVVALKKIKQSLGDDNLVTLSVMEGLASTYLNQGQWKEAETLQAMVMEKTKQQLGNDHPNTLTSMANLAVIYQHQGQWKEAEAFDIAVLEKRKQKLGDDHRDTLASMENVAAAYSNQGRWKEAEVFDVVVLEKRKQKLGCDHPETLRSMGNLAFTYWLQGRWAEAQEIQATVIDKRKQKLGDDHPDTLASMGNLAVTYRSQGQLEEAEALEVLVMEKRKQKLGDDHPAILVSMNCLATTYQLQSQWKKAELLQTEVLEKRKQRLGDDHPDTLRSMGNLAVTYRNQDQWKEAEALEIEVLQKRKQKFGDDHPHTLSSMEGLAATYEKLGHHEEAKALYTIVTQKSEQTLGVAHPDTLRRIVRALMYSSRDLS